MNPRAMIRRAALAASIATAGSMLCLAGASAQGYGGPSYEGRDDGRYRDRDWHGHSAWDSRSGEAGGWTERSARRQFERGYRLGRRDALEEIEERASGPAAARDKGTEDRIGSSDRDEREGTRSELQELSRQAVRQARDSLQDARSALQRDDRRAAEDALDRAAKALRPDEESRPAIDRSLDALERALDRDDREAALSALRRAREAARDQRPTGSPPSGGQGSGSDKGSPEKGAAPSPAPKDAPATGGKT